MRIQYLFCLALFLAVMSCSGDDPEMVNEVKVITNLDYILMPAAGGIPVTMRYQDLDGNGGTPAIITGGQLAANTLYNADLAMTNELTFPLTNVSAEIRLEDNEHQIFYSSSLADMEFSYRDKDSDDNPLGLATSLQTGSPGTGTISIIVRLNPDKNANGVSDGDITNAGGLTHVEVTFDVTVL